MKSIQTIYNLSEKLYQSPEDEISSIWTEIQFKTIPKLSSEYIEQQILPKILINVNLSHPAQFRVWTCRVIGAVAEKLNTNIFQDKLLPKVQNLCQDTDGEVRSSMCRQLNTIGKTIGLRLSKSLIVPEFQELLLDDDETIRDTALKCLMETIDFWDTDIKLSVVIPTWKKLMEEENFFSLQLASELFGRFIWCTKDQTNEYEKQCFVNWYISNARSSNEEFRRLCAFNFPGVLKSVGMKNFEKFGLNSAITVFLNDTNIKVRETLAASFHEIAKIMNFTSFQILQPPFIQLLSESNISVFSALISNLSNTLGSFLLDESSRKETNADELLFLILRRERECLTNHDIKWRMHEELIKQFGTQKFAEYFEVDQLRDYCIPLMFKLFSENVVMPIKERAIQALSLYMEYLQYQDLENVCKQIQELKYSSTYKTRLTFLSILPKLQPHFSSHFIISNFFDQSVALLQDPVPNVRLKCISTISLMRKFLHQSQASKPNIEKLHILTDRLRNAIASEHDRDVLNAIRNILVGGEISLTRVKNFLKNNGDLDIKFEESDAFEESEDTRKKEREENLLRNEYSEELRRRKEKEVIIGGIVGAPRRKSLQPNFGTKKKNSISSPATSGKGKLPVGPSQMQSSTSATANTQNASSLTSQSNNSRAGKTQIRKKSAGTILNSNPMITHTLNDDKCSLPVLPNLTVKPHLTQTQSQKSNSPSRLSNPATQKVPVIEQKPETAQLKKNGSVLKGLGNKGITGSGGNLSGNLNGIGVVVKSATDRHTKSAGIQLRTNQSGNSDSSRGKNS
ncbi:Serine/threonine-protein phosphatase 4 regulatory subunit 4 [Nowakowskiella sp. JEL0407]|nr:Serine/threonine-protein phosphatase 4 regulatory subunit 4 [Nowakowskiella sp. JEL0407]